MKKNEEHNNKGLTLGQAANLTEIHKVLNGMDESERRELVEKKIINCLSDETRECLDKAYTAFAEKGFDTPFILFNIFAALQRQIRKSLEEQGFRYDFKRRRWLKSE